MPAFVQRRSPKPLNQLARKAAGSYTLSGPSSGTVNVASTNFTITPDGFSSAVVTPASNGAGSFSPATVTFDGTGGAMTFTYTPTSQVGSPHTISVTNDSALTNPGSLSYTVNAAGAATALLLRRRRMAAA